MKKNIRGRFDFRFAHEMTRKYSGKFAAVIDDKVVAAGNDRLEVFRKAEKMSAPKMKIGIFYFPTKKEMLTAL